MRPGGDGAAAEPAGAPNAPGAASAQAHEVTKPLVWAQPFHAALRVSYCFTCLCCRWLRDSCAKLQTELIMHTGSCCEQ